MKNIQEIKLKLAKFRNSEEIHQLLNTAPEAILLNKEVKEVLSNISKIFINKLIKHLDSKNPSKSSISNLILRSFQKLQQADMDDNERQCYFLLITKIINNTFEGAFSNRLNVKSQEFLDLEDCESF